MFALVCGGVPWTRHAGGRPPKCDFASAAYINRTESVRSIICLKKTGIIYWPGLIGITSDLKEARTATSCCYDKTAWVGSPLSQTGFSPVKTTSSTSAAGGSVQSQVV